jgi:hypothetical protein
MSFYHRLLAIPPKQAFSSVYLAAWIKAEIEFKSAGAPLTEPTHSQYIP